MRIIHAALIGLTLAAAGTGAALAADTPSAATTEALKRFEGSWAGSQSVTLVKAYPGHLHLSGRDAGSTWQAHCVLRSGAALCRGLGQDNKGRGFAFESRMSLDGEQLRDQWKALFFDDNELTGAEQSRRLPVP